MMSEVFYDPENSSGDGVALIFKVKKLNLESEKYRLLVTTNYPRKELAKTITLNLGELYDDSSLKGLDQHVEELYKGYWRKSESRLKSSRWKMMMELRLFLKLRTKKGR